ncbi:MAG: molybdate transporter periplasmic protein [Methanoregulaceae archaeon PtaB.Bin108]|nr:MAG: molybdate transporter periplasmic protein [Methanoregulaceae archaeon PtaB.Bin108]
MKFLNLTALLMAAVLLAALIVAGCTTGPSQPAATPTPTAVQQKELTVFAAASLTGVVTEIAHDYELLHPGVKVVTNFDGSQALRTQIEQGAYADVFLSANTKHMNALRDKGLMENASIGLFVKNKLAVITPASNPANIHTLQNLSNPGVRLVIGTKDVPVGDYARQILTKMANDTAYGPSYQQAVLKNVISEETTVTAVVAKVQLGEADAGIVYESDITPENRNKFMIIAIPDKFNVIAEYPAGIVKDSRNKDEASRFIDYLKSDPGRATLVKFGFAMP